MVKIVLLIQKDTLRCRQWPSESLKYIVRDTERLSHFWRSQKLESQGPVQSIVSFTPSLVKDSISLLILIKSSVLIFLLKICEELLQCKSSSHLFGKNDIDFSNINSKI